MTTAIIGLDRRITGWWFDDFLYRRPPVRRVHRWRRPKTFEEKLRELSNGLRASRAERAAKNRAACRRRWPLPRLASQTSRARAVPVVIAREPGRDSSTRSRATLGAAHPLNAEVA